MRKNLSGSACWFCFVVLVLRRYRGRSSLPRTLGISSSSFPLCTKRLLRACDVANAGQSLFSLSLSLSLSLSSSVFFSSVFFFLSCDRRTDFRKKQKEEKRRREREREAVARGHDGGALEEEEERERERGRERERKRERGWVGTVSSRLRPSPTR